MSEIKNLAATETEKMQAMQLFEKGLLSKQTLISVHGYDPIAEMEKLATERVELEKINGSRNKGKRSTVEMNEKHQMISDITCAIEQFRRTAETLDKVNRSMEINFYLGKIKALSEEMFNLCVPDKQVSITVEETLPGNG